MGKQSTRENWVDNVKTIACILVVLGHFFQSMVKSDLIQSNWLYEWFNYTIYMFHVPLFFICSGYLYQKYSVIDTFVTWWKNILKKALVLGVPYFTFSIITWLLKTFFSGSVNRQVDSFFESLFLQPMAPYWYLYCLFTLFIFIPTFKNKKVMSFFILFALIFKILSSFCNFNIYAFSVMMQNGVWFILGMCICFTNFSKHIGKKSNIQMGMVLLIVFIIGSVIFQRLDESALKYHINFILGMIACCSIVLIIGYLFRKNKNNMFFNFMARYTMPIYLMHTIFAATLRSILLKVNVTNIFIHMTLGIVIGFVGPIVLTTIMEKTKWMDFFLYPSKYIKIN